MLGDTSCLRAPIRSCSPSSSSCIILATSGGPNIIWQRQRPTRAIQQSKNARKNTIDAHILPTWLIIDTTNQSLYRGVDARLHLEALSLPKKSSNHDILCYLDNSLTYTYLAQRVTWMPGQLCHS